jgi:hypothetical protein
MATSPTRSWPNWTTRTEMRCRVSPVSDVGWVAWSPNRCSHPYAVSSAERIGLVRVLGVDPGLTRCGLGVVDGRPGRAGMVAVGVVRTPSDRATGERLLYLEDKLTTWVRRFEPDVVAIERVFADVNVASVMTTAHATAIACSSPPRRRTGRLPHPHRGQGGRHRRRARRKGPGQPRWSPASSNSPSSPSLPTLPTLSPWPSATPGEGDPDSVCRGRRPQPPGGPR